VSGVILGLLLILTARFDPAGNAAIQGFFADLTAPVSAAGRSVVRGASTALGGMEAYIEAGSKNRDLENTVKAQRAMLIKGKADVQEIVRLKRLLKLVEDLPHPFVAARLVSSSATSSRRYATLAAGQVNGILMGQPVRSSEGLVGRIVQAGRLSSRILLIVDGGNVVPIKRLSDGLPAMAIGRGDGRLEIKPLDAAVNPFRRGDIFVTSGAGGIYQPGIPVAVGVVQLRETTLALPLANPAQLDFAIVEPVFVAEPTPVLAPPAKDLK
jgi:rod shape-determining protein MreC